MALRPERDSFGEAIDRTARCLDESHRLWDQEQARLRRIASDKWWRDTSRLVRWLGLTMVAAVVSRSLVVATSPLSLAPAHHWAELTMWAVCFAGVAALLVQGIRWEIADQFDQVHRKLLKPERDRDDDEGENEGDPAAIGSARTWNLVTECVRAVIEPLSPAIIVALVLGLGAICAVLSGLLFELVRLISRTAHTWW